MCKWFNKNKNEKEIKKDKIINNIVNNYETKENGDIKIKVWIHDIFYGSYKYKSDIVISKSSIVSHTKDTIIFKDYRCYYNFEYSGRYYTYKDTNKSIEEKESFIKYKEAQIKTYEYLEKDNCWKLKNTDVVGTEVVNEKTPLEVFKEESESKYKLIETEDEFNEYMSSSLDCDTWCRKKLYNKMKELGLGDGFINQFADLVGNDLDKYYAMIDLANEVTDKDTLMYLYTYKFR